MMTFGEIVRFYREKQNYKQEVLSAMLNVDRSEISKYETDVALPSAGRIRMLRLILEIPFNIYYEAFEAGLARPDPKEKKLKQIADDLCSKDDLSVEDQLVVSRYMQQNATQKMKERKKYNEDSKKRTK